MFSEAVARRGIGSPHEAILREETGGEWSLYLLTKSIISVESAWIPVAIRQEPELGDASRGLMQILYATAKDMGYTGTPDGLFDPATNIRYGVRFLRYLISRWGSSLSDVISAYNGGHPLRRTGGGYVNQQYVDDVNTYLMWYQNNEPSTIIPPEPVPPADPQGNLVDNAGQPVLDVEGNAIPASAVQVVDNVVVWPDGTPILGSDEQPIAAIVPAAGGSAVPFRRG